MLTLTPMKLRSFVKLILIAAFPVADVASVMLLGRFIGILPTLVLVLVSTVVGLVASGRYLRKLGQRSVELKAKHGGDVPRELQVVDAPEGFITLLLMLMFIFPGLLSDFAAFILLLPKFQQGSYDLLVRTMRKEAERQGKSLEEFLTPRCSK